MRTRLAAVRAGDIALPVNQTFGFVLGDDADPAEQMTLTWTVGSEYCNTAGNAQGGVLAAFADAALGAACAAHLDENLYPALIEMKISILRPAAAGAELTARGHVLKKGRRVLFVEAEITDSTGTLVASASGTELPTQAP